MFVVPILPDTHQQFIQATLTYHTPLDELQQQLEHPVPTSTDVYTLAIIQLLNLDYKAADASFQQALHLATEEDRALMALHCRRGIAKVTLETTNPTNLADWAQLLEAYQQIGQAGDVAATAIQYAKAAYQAFDIKLAESILAQYQDAIYPDDTISQIMLLRLHAYLNLPQKQLDTSFSFLNQALAVAKQHSCREEEANIYLTQAWLYTLQTEFTQAQQSLDQALSLANTYNLKLVQALHGKNSSIFYTRQAQFTQAVKPLYQAREILKELGKPFDEAECMVNLGLLYQNIGHLVAAQSTLLVAEQLFQRFNAQRKLAVVWFNLAVISFEQGQLDQVDYYLDQVFELAADTAHREIYTESQLLQARVLRQRGQTQQALEIFNQLRPHYLKTDTSNGYARILIEQAEIYLFLKQLNQARELYKEAQSTLNQDPLQEWRCLYGLAKCAEQEKEYHIALNYYHQALRLVGDVRQNLLNELLSSMVYRKTSDLFTDSLACAMKAGSPLDRVRMTEQQRAITFLQQTRYNSEFKLTSRQQDLRSELEAAVQMITSNDDVLDHVLLEEKLDSYTREMWADRIYQHTPTSLGAESFVFDLQRIQEVCSDYYQDNWTILMYTKHQADSCMCSVITPTNLFSAEFQWYPWFDEFIPKLGDPTQRSHIFTDIKYRMFQERPHLQRGGVPLRPWHRHAELAEAVLPEIVQQRVLDNPDHRLFVLPSSTLHMLPWATLRIKDRWLCELAVVHVLPHLEALLRIPKVKQGVGYFYGCETFDDPLYTPLFDPTDELALIQEMWGTAIRDFLPAHYVDVLDSSMDWQHAALLQFSTHAWMSETHGIASHIALKDRNLWINTIESFQLDHALVILSACKGAKVDEMPGEEYLSLAWSWLAAGASSVIASLWDLQEGGFLEVLRYLYQYIQQGYDTAKALAYAQRRCCQDSPYDGEHWGSFIHTGGLHSISIVDEVLAP